MICSQCGIFFPFPKKAKAVQCACGAIVKSGGEALSPSSPVYIDSGVGTELTMIFAEIGAKHTHSCDCRAKAAEMNRVGIEGVKSNREKYLAWMREAYQTL